MFSAQFNVGLISGSAGRDDKRLLEKFMNDSNPNVRPVKNIEDQVNVTFDITLHGVIEMVSYAAFLFSLPSLVLIV